MSILSNHYPEVLDELNGREPAVIIVHRQPALVAMPSWKRVWREGLAPQLTDRQLLALFGGLLADDPALIQGATTDLPAIAPCADHPIACGCVLTYAVWKAARGPMTVSEAEGQFCQLCTGCDELLSEPGIVRHFLDWFDDAHRETMRREMLAEIERELARRGMELETAA